MEETKRRINKYILLFLLGGFLGWCIELVYRSITLKQVVNPGFLSGPHLPIYGFGLVLLTIILNNGKLHWLLNIFSFAVVATTMELVSGWFFEYFFHLRLWDYSDEWGNWRGWICPRFFLYWLLFSVFYYLFFYKIVTKKVNHTLKSRVKLGLAYTLIFIIFIDLTHSFYSAGLIGSGWADKYKKTFPVLSNYKIFKPDHATNFINSITQSIKNYSNYNLPDKIFKK